MYNAARIVARPAVAAAAAVATAGAAQGPAHARAPPSQGAVRQAAHPPTHPKLVDRDAEGWLLTELQDEVVLFQPYDEKEVDDAANAVMALWGGRPSNLSDRDGSERGSSSGDSFTSDGHHADAVIESGGAAAAAVASAAVQAGIGSGGAGGEEQAELQGLMAITTRMLRRPGLQREVVKCMLEDVEVRQLMMRHCDNLDRYLLAAGVLDPALLPPAEEVSSTDGAAAPTRGTIPSFSAASATHGSAGPNLVTRLVGAMAGALERAGDALAFLGGWLRQRLAFLLPPEEEEEAEDEQLEGCEAAEGGGRGGKRKADQVLGGVMVLAVAVFCMAVIRRPLVLRALARR